MRIALALLLAAGTAAAAPAPFVSYHSPAPMCDERPVTAVCRAAERRQWREFLSSKLDQYFPHITKARLADLFFPGNEVRYGWAFRIIVPQAPARWRRLAITVGGVPVGTDPYTRYERDGSGVVDVTIERSKLAPGIHTISATDGATTVFSFPFELEDSAVPPPVDAAKLDAEAAAAAKRPAFTVAALPTRPACAVSPQPAGCHQSTKRMWNELFDGTLPGHPHLATFSKQSRLDVFGKPMWHWSLYLVFPTASAKWFDRDLQIQLDGKEAKYANRRKLIGTEALLVELTFLETDHAPGKHQLRAIDRAGTELFSQQIELEK